jgi:hypothetical protein
MIRWRSMTISRKRTRLVGPTQIRVLVHHKDHARDEKRKLEAEKIHESGAACYSVGKAIRDSWLSRMSGKPAVRNGMPRCPVSRALRHRSCSVPGFRSWLDYPFRPSCNLLSHGPKMIRQHPLQRLPSPSPGFSALIHVCIWLRAWDDRGKVPWLTSSGSGSC